MKLTLTYIQALDHYSAESEKEQECLMEVCGVFVREEGPFIILRHIKADINLSDSAAEFHFVLKSAVKFRKDFVIEEL